MSNYRRTSLFLTLSMISAIFSPTNLISPCKLIIIRCVLFVQCRLIVIRLNSHIRLLSTVASSMIFMYISHRFSSLLDNYSRFLHSTMQCPKPGFIPSQFEFHCIYRYRFIVRVCVYPARPFFSYMYLINDSIAFC